MKNGYTDAFGPQHTTPDGRKLPQGEYPVGLTRGTGFGWGTQSITKAVDELRAVQDEITLARLEIAGTGQAKVIEQALDRAVAHLRGYAHQDSTMAAKLIGFFEKSLRRLRGAPRFLPDPSGKALAAELATARTYIQKQLSLDTQHAGPAFRAAREALVGRVAADVGPQTTYWAGQEAFHREFLQEIVKQCHGRVIGGSTNIAARRYVEFSLPEVDESFKARLTFVDGNEALLLEGDTIHKEIPTRPLATPTTIARVILAAANEYMEGLLA